MLEDNTIFDDFWEASCLNRFNIQEFARRQNAYNSDDKQLILEYPTASVPLPLAKTQINKIAQKRQSGRLFSDKELSVKELGQLLSSFYAWNGLEHRGYPSAGATYTTEIFFTAFNAESFTGKTIYYDPEKHGTVVVSDKAPSWAEASKSLNMNVEGVPALLLIFVTFPKRVTAKYGERGGRFALLEAGAAMQQLSLQIAESKKLKGVAVGGMLDATWRQYLRLEESDAHIALGYLVGK